MRIGRRLDIAPLGRWRRDFLDVPRRYWTEYRRTGRVLPRGTAPRAGRRWSCSIPGHGGHDPGAQRRGRHAGKGRDPGQRPRAEDRAGGDRALSRRTDPHRGPVTVALEDRVGHRARPRREPVSVDARRSSCRTPRCAAPRSTLWRGPRRTPKPRHWRTGKTGWFRARTVICRHVAPEVSEILASLAARETRAASARIARQLVRDLERDLPVLPRPERHANFTVLHAAGIPSVLIEMGFLSNADDEAALNDPGAPRLIARAMTRAVDAWFSTGGLATDERTCLSLTRPASSSDLNARFPVPYPRISHIWAPWMNL